MKAHVPDETGFQGASVSGGAAVSSRMTESQSMSSPPGITGCSGMPTPSRMMESQSMSLPPGMTDPQSASSLSGMGGQRTATSTTPISLSMPPPQRTMESLNMPGSLPGMESSSTGPCLRNMGSLSMWPVSGLAGSAVGGPAPVLQENVEGGWLEWVRRQGGEVPRPGGDLGRYVGAEGAHGSPMSVMDLPPPPPPRPPVGEAVSGTVIGAPPQGLVCLQGVWQPYTMVQGQMAVQFQRDAGSGCSTAGVVPSVVPPLHA